MTIWRTLACVLVATFLFEPLCAIGQVVVRSMDGGLITTTPTANGEITLPMGTMPGSVVAQPAPTPNAGDAQAKPADAAAVPAKAEGDKGDKEANKPVHRPDAPDKSPHPDEFKLRPGPNGKIRLNFNGQPWQPILEWLATISDMSLDWQQLPGDSLNLATHRSYTVPEVRDIINRHLLMRGYTILCHGEVMTVAEIKKLDPSLVPRVSPDELDKRAPNEFVKTSFAMTTMSAETAVDELRPMLSANSKMSALPESNRLEVMDAVANLRDVAAILKSQSSDDALPRSFHEFVLAHARADDVERLLASLFEIDTKGQGGGGGGGGVAGMNPQQMQQMMMAQQAGGNPGQPAMPVGPGPKQHGAAISLAVNTRRNSLLVRAAPDKLTLVSQVIASIDVPVDDGTPLLKNVNRMTVYRLSGVDPEPVVKTLLDIGNLEPTTRLEIDRKNSAIIAYATLPDHVTIRALIDKLNGSERKFEVLPLRHLAADYVAGTIEFMFGSAQKKDRPRFPWMMDDSTEKTANPRDFHVDADVDQNRLLIFANPVEMAAIQELLVKLGEIPANGVDKTRVLDAGDAQATQELIKRIQESWPSIAPNPLQIAPQVDPRPAGNELQIAPRPAPVTTPKSNQTTSEEVLSPYLHLAQLRSEKAQAPTASDITSSNKIPSDRVPNGSAPTGSSTGAATPNGISNSEANKTRSLPDLVGSSGLSGGPAGSGLPPVKISVGADGKLIISSDDPRALDSIESFAQQTPVARKDYHIFHLRYALASAVTTNLQDFFNEDKKENNNGNSRWFFFDNDQRSDDSNQRRLSKRRKLRFVSDVDTNTILVSGADSGQLRTIGELVDIYDTPPPSDSQSVRRTELIRLRYSKAKPVADTVKDVYRDLLSANDKALGTEKPSTVREYYFDSYSGDNKEQKSPKFKGLLSIGVDEVSNSLMVSAPAYLFEHVSHMISELDKAAKPDYTVETIQIPRGVTAEQMKEIVDAVYLNKHVDKSGSTAPKTDKSSKPKESKEQKGKDSSSE